MRRGERTDPAWVGPACVGPLCVGPVCVGPVCVGPRTVDPAPPGLTAFLRGTVTLDPPMGPSPDAPSPAPRRPAPRTTVRRWRCPREACIARHGLHDRQMGGGEPGAQRHFQEARCGGPDVHRDDPWSRNRGGRGVGGTGHTRSKGAMAGRRNDGVGRGESGSHSARWCPRAGQPVPPQDPGSGVRSSTSTNSTSKTRVEFRGIRPRPSAP